jgi:hypothetical protein
MGTLLDVLRALLDGALRSGAISEQVHRAAHEVVDANDPAVAEARAQAEAFSADDQAQLDALLAKQAQAQQAPAEQPQAPTASPLLPGGAPVQQGGQVQ